MASVYEHPLVQHGGEPTLLGQRDKDRRGDPAPGRVLPPQQRLDTCQAAGGELDDRLVVDLEVIARHRLAQVVDERQLIL